MTPQAAALEREIARVEAELAHARRVSARFRGLLSETAMHLRDRPMSQRAYSGPSLLMAIEAALRETL